MSDPETAAGASDDSLVDGSGIPAGGPGDDAASGGSTGATALDAADPGDEDSGGHGDDAAAGETTAPPGA